MQIYFLLAFIRCADIVHFDGQVSPVLHFEFNAMAIKETTVEALALGTDFLPGIGTIEGRMLLLLDIEHLMSPEERGLVERLAARIDS
jgi:chemotaxis signal transduction protein